MFTKTMRIRKRSRLTKKMKGGQTGTTNLPKGNIYETRMHNVKAFYEEPNPLLVSKSKSKGKLPTATRKHVDNVLKLLRKLKSPSK